MIFLKSLYQNNWFAKNGKQSKIRLLQAYDCYKLVENMMYECIKDKCSFSSKYKFNTKYELELEGCIRFYQSLLYLVRTRMRLKVAGGWKNWGQREKTLLIFEATIQSQSQVLQTIFHYFDFIFKNFSESSEMFYGKKQ